MIFQPLKQSEKNMFLSFMWLGGQNSYSHNTIWNELIVKIGENSS